MHTKIKIWDTATRLFHWLLVFLVLFLWYSADIADDLMQWHLRAGKLLLALIVFRIIWGFFGSQTSRFSDFIHSPFAFIAYFLSYFSRKKRAKTPLVVGHNPAGGYMVLVMLLVLLIQIISGLGNSDDIFLEGNLYQYLDEDTAEWMAIIHYYNFYLIIALVVMHLIAIFSYLFKGDNLIIPMVTGYKKFKDSQINTKNTPYFVHGAWALAIFSVVLLIGFYLLK